MKQQEFEYFYGNESRQYDFYMIPKVLFTDDAFLELSITAKVVYAILLNRSALSAQNGFRDEENRVFINFRTAELQSLLHLSCATITTCFKDLSGCGLIEKVRAYFNKPDRIYVKNFMAPLISCSEEPGCAENSGLLNFKTPAVQCLKDRNFKNQNTGHSNLEVPDVQNLNVQRFKNQHTGCQENECPLDNNKNHKKESNYTDQSIRKSDDYEIMSKTLADNLEIDKMRDSMSPEEFEDYNLVYRFVLDFFKSKKAETKIGKNNLKTGDVKKELLNLTPNKVKTVILRISSADTSKVTNYHAYLLSCLYKEALQSSDQEQIQSGIAALFNKRKQESSTKFDDFNDEWLTYLGKR